MSGQLDVAERAAEASERQTLDAFLDFHGDALVRKIGDVSGEGARHRLVASGTTLGGLLEHLRGVEMNWFQRVFAQRPADELPVPPWTDDDPEADFRVEPEGWPPEHTVPHRRMGNVSLRWIYLHMIEETARHVGHVDILCERVDGTVGD